MRGGPGPAKSAQTQFIAVVLDQVRGRFSMATGPGAILLKEARPDVLALDREFFSPAMVGQRGQGLGAPAAANFAVLQQWNKSEGLREDDRLFCQPARARASPDVFGKPGPTAMRTAPFDKKTYFDVPTCMALLRCTAQTPHPLPPSHRVPCASEISFLARPSCLRRRPWVSIMDSALVKVSTRCRPRGVPPLQRWRDKFCVSNGSHFAAAPE